MIDHLTTVALLNATNHVLNVYLSNIERILSL